MTDQPQYQDVDVFADEIATLDKDDAILNAEDAAFTQQIADLQLALTKAQGNLVKVKGRKQASADSRAFFASKIAEQQPVTTTPPPDETVPSEAPVETAG